MYESAAETAEDLKKWGFLLEHETTANTGSWRKYKKTSVNTQSH